LKIKEKRIETDRLVLTYQRIYRPWLKEWAIINRISVHEKGTNRPVGFFLIHNSFKTDSPQMGYDFFLRRNEGFCTEALIALMDTDVIPVVHRRLEITNKNWRSSNVAGKAGFKLCRQTPGDGGFQIWKHPTLLEYEKEIKNGRISDKAA
jgi:RimJ/RimL family protein N-acetyltransferase